MMIIESLVSKIFGENTWIIGDKELEKAVIIDPGASFEKVKEKIDGLNLTPILLLNTHLHPDHIISAKELQQYYQIPCLAHQAGKKLFDSFDQIAQMLGFTNLEKPNISNWLSADQVIENNNFKLKIIHTPGHSPGSSCFLFNELYLFTGDTLFSGSIGRTDLPLSSTAEMRKSLKKIVNLPINTKLYPGHGPKSTLEKELNNNPYLI